MSLVEVLVTSGILLLLLAVLTAVYVRASSVWRKVDMKTELLRELQVALRKLERNLELSHPKGVAKGDKSVAYLSLRDKDDKVVMDPLGPVWQKFVAVYVDPTGFLREATVFRASPNPTPCSFSEETGATLDQWLGMTANTDHRLLTHSGQVTQFELTRTGDYGSLYELKVAAERKNGSDITEKVQLQSVVSVRGN